MIEQLYLIKEDGPRQTKKNLTAYWSFIANIGAIKDCIRSKDSWFSQMQLQSSYSIVAYEKQEIQKSYLAIPLSKAQEHLKQLNYWQQMLILVVL